ncbi:MAG: helicase C-terminal domain-containing protein [Chloroflexota bacterium]
MESFVALDLELTPYSGDQQRIIEIAAVRFRDGRVADSFSTLIDPRCGINHRIEVLTGICQQQVDAAPGLHEVVPSFLDFVGDDPVVGQSIQMDLEALSSSGVRLPNSSYDTFELASLLLPGLPGYDLGTIARSMGVETEQEHRALCDAVVAGRVFLSLLEQAAGLGLGVLAQLNNLSEQLPEWPFRDLFVELQRRRLKQHFVAHHPSPITQHSPLTTQHSEPRTRNSEPAEEELTLLPPERLVSKPSLKPVSQPSPIDLDELSALLGSGGTVASSLSGFEKRDEQLRMMRAVAEAFNGSDHLLVEAGTGTGKSMAYLLPSIYHAARTGQRVVISTNTLNLQDQLYHKDIPALQSCLPVEFRAALLKGRGNYVCLRRWMVLSRTPNLDPAELQLLIKTLVWLSGTETGDRSELNLSAAESALWPRISAQAESCALSSCPQFRRGNCFVMRARRAAESAHIVVVNHALLLSDLAASGGVLPEYSHVVVDEAHHLEEEATEQLGFTLSWGDLYSFLAGLHQLSTGRRAMGFLPELGGALRQKVMMPEDVTRIRTLLSAAGNAVEAVLEEGRSFFEAVNCFLYDHAEERPRAGVRLRVTTSVRTQPGWSEIEVGWSELSEKLHSLHRQLQRLSSAIQPLEEREIAEREGILAEIGGFQSYLERLCTQGEEIVSAASPNGIYWISGGSVLEDLALRSAPLHVGDALNSALFACKDSVVLTSATLTTEGSFDYVRERLGLEDARELMVGSPFDYKRSTLLYVAHDMPEPARPASQRAVESAIADIALAMEGRTLVLFTSHAQLRLTSSAIRSQLEERGILLLAHGMDGSRRRLLQAFMTSPRAVLMGTSSFWEGIDVVGEALSCLVIVKLPFSVPTDPIFAARSEVFEEPFRQYSVPQTILRLKQGFGRLIRSRTDRGIVVILDSRVGNKFYGPAFIHSLPECTVRMGPAAHLAEAARDWLSR